MAALGGFWELADVLARKASRDDGRVPATYLYTDDSGTAWVQLAGADEPTPVNGMVMADLAQGDVVEAVVGGGVVSVVGNASSPAVGQRVVEAIVSPVRSAAESLARATATARDIADAAKRVADAIDQHFWTDTSGIHVTNSTQEDWAANQSGPNVLINSIGQLFRDGLNNLVAITTESGAKAISFYNGLGNAADNITAYFGTDGARIGYSGSSNISIEPIGMRIVNYLGSTVASILSTGYVSPTSTTRLLTASQCTHDMTYDINTNTMHPVIVDNVLMTIAAEYKVLSSGTTKTATFSISEAGTEVTVDELTLWVMPYDESNLYRQFQIHVRLRSTVDIGQVKLNCSWKYARYMPNYSFGSGTATGGYALSEGGGNTASGNCSHAEGDVNTASHYASHAEGSENTASGSRSHAEGYKTTASGNWSHAGGRGTIAAYDAQTAIGRYNDNQSNNAFEIGNGEDPESRSNAFAVDWDGSVETIGMATVYSPTIEDNTTYNSNVGGNGLVMRNGSGTFVGQIRAYARSGADRLRGLQIGGYNEAATAYNYLYLMVDKDGNRIVQVSEVAPWLDMLGLSVSSTTAAGVSGGTVNIRRTGKVVTVQCTGLKLASALANNTTSATLATVPSGYRPPWNVYGVLAVASVDAGGSYVRIDSAGAITVRNQSGSSMATSLNFAMTITYVIS